MYDELVKVLTDRFSPINNWEILQKLKFYSHSRKPGENVLSYVAELYVLDEHCKFIGRLDVMICNRLVSGINEDSIQKWLSMEGDQL